MRIFDRYFLCVCGCSLRGYAFQKSAERAAEALNNATSLSRSRYHVHEREELDGSGSCPCRVSRFDQQNTELLIEIGEAFVNVDPRVNDLVEKLRFAEKHGRREP